MVQFPQAGGYVQGFFKIFFHAGGMILKFPPACFFWNIKIGSVSWDCQMLKWKEKGFCLQAFPKAAG